jgi:hypothetical protein
MSRLNSDPAPPKLLDEQIEALNSSIAQRLEAQKELIQRLDLVPGGSQGR